MPMSIPMLRRRADQPSAPLPANPGPCPTLIEQLRSQWRALLGFGALAMMLVLMMTLVADNRSVVQDRMARGRLTGQTLEVLLVSEKLRFQIVRAIQAERGFLLTHERVFLEPLTAARMELPRLLRRLDELTMDNPAQRAPVIELSTNLAAYMAFIETEVVLEEVGNHSAAIKRVVSGRGFHSVDRLMKLIDLIVEREQKLLGERRRALDEADSRTEQSLQVVWWLGLLLLSVAFAAAIAAFRAFRQARIANARLERAVTTDALTGLHNRRAFFDRLEAVSSAKDDRPLAVAMVDVDHFKSVNDRFGHPGGDEALRTVAATLQGSVRAGDHVARIGGEEFAILFEGLDLPGAGIACEEVRARVAKVPITLANGEVLGVTLSLGVATRHPGEGGEALIARADRALYEAKTNGRNRVRLAA